MINVSVLEIVYEQQQFIFFPSGTMAVFRSAMTMAMALAFDGGHGCSVTRLHTSGVNIRGSNFWHDMLHNFEKIKL